MGCYDFFEGRCPQCDEEFSIQTKIGECSFENFTIGSAYPQFKDAVLEIKDCCLKCETEIAVVIHDHIITRFIKAGDLNPTHQESLRGKLQEYLEKDEIRTETTILPSDKDRELKMGLTLSERYTEEDIAANKYRIQKHPPDGFDISDLISSFSRYSCNFPRRDS